MIGTPDVVDMARATSPTTAAPAPSEAPARSAPCRLRSGDQQDQDHQEDGDRQGNRAHGHGPANRHAEQDGGAPGRRGDLPDGQQAHQGDQGGEERLGEDRLARGEQVAAEHHHRRGTGRHPRVVPS